MPRTIDNGTILAAVRSQPQVVWPNKATSKWDERRKQIIDRCLNLDLKKRWPDLREVMREFERLEADFLLEDAREKIEIEKKRQARKVFLLRAAALVLGTAFVVASVYGISYGLLTLNRAKTAETTIVENAASHLNEVTARESTISTLSTQVEEEREARRVADANLQMSQEAVDNLLTQILEMPAGLGLGSDISDKPINDALSFYAKEREQLKNTDDLLPERARNYFNTAQLLMRQQKRQEAQDFFEQAKTTLDLLLKKQPDHSDLPRRQALLGRTCRWLGTLKSDDGKRAEAAVLFEQAVASLDPAFNADKENRSTRDEAAIAYYELGKRQRRDGDTQDAVVALQKARDLLDLTALPDKKLNNVEQFLLARSQIEQALALRDTGKEDDAMKALFDAMEVMVKLVERAAPNNKEQALTLAEAYVEFGSLISGKLGSTDAKDAHAEAQAILMELLRVDPQWAEARYLLARSYGDLAGIERDEGNGSEAVRKQSTAVKTLAELSKDNAKNTRFLSELARQEGQQAQLLCDLGKAKDAIPLAQQAVTQIEALLAGDAQSLDELDRKTCGVLLAQLYGILGSSGEIARNSTLAKTSFTKASAQWQALQERHGSDDIIVQGLDWTKSKLKGMK